MIARAVVALGGGNLTDLERADGKLAQCERAEFAGEGATWEAAKAAAGVPDDGFVMYWTQVPPH